MLTSNISKNKSIENIQSVCVYEIRTGRNLYFTLAGLGFNSALQLFVVIISCFSLSFKNIKKEVIEPSRKLILTLRIFLVPWLSLFKVSKVIWYTDVSCLGRGYYNKIKIVLNISNILYFIWSIGTRDNKMLRLN